MTLFTTARRTQARLRLAIDGPSGSGKTYSGLLIAKGLAGGDLAKVALVDTERGSGSLYADLGPYAVLDFEPPYSVDRYLKAMQAAIEEGFDVVVFDSLTPAWSGVGGILDFVDSVAKTRTGGNTFRAWAEGTPMYQKLIDGIVSAPLHVICTMRSKTEYVVEQNDRGKSAPRKIGLAPDQRRDIDYEFTLVLDMTREHIATASKDRTGIWDARMETPAEKHGVELAEWLGSADRGPIRQVQRDERAEQLPAPDRAEEGNGHISQSQARRLHEMLYSKGRETPRFLEALAHNKGIGDGEHLTSIPTADYETVLRIVIDMADQASPEKPAEAPQAAPEPQADPDPSDDEEPPGMDAEAYKARRAAEAAAAAEKPRKKGTVTAPQLTRLGALCADLENEGMGRDEWRLWLFENEKVVSRTELTKAAATRAIDHFQRLLLDFQTGVSTPAAERTKP